MNPIIKLGLSLMATGLAAVSLSKINLNKKQKSLTLEEEIEEIGNEAAREEQRAAQHLGNARRLWEDFEASKQRWEDRRRERMAAVNTARSYARPVPFEIRKKKVS